MKYISLFFLFYNFSTVLLAEDQLERVLITDLIQSGNLMPLSEGTLTTKITFKITSGGCTYAKDIAIKITTNDDGGTFVRVVRVKPDPCERVPGPVTLTKELTDLPYIAGVENVKLENPLLMVDKTTH